jgi:biotin synthase
MTSVTEVKTTAEWSIQDVMALFEKSFMDLVYEAHRTHRQHFPEFNMQLSTLLNIKTGGCPEDCHYCPQAARYHTGVKAEKLMDAEAIKNQAACAKEAGATRFCMGAAWRELKDRDVPKMVEVIRQVKSLGLETCMTLGMLTEPQARALKEAGLDYYNHNLDTSPEHYSEIITTRSYDERLKTLDHVREVGMKVCCGGIVGLGESREDRAGMLAVLA